MQDKPSIWLDTYRTQVPHSGLGQFSMQLARHLAEVGKDKYEFIFYGWGGKDYTANVHPYDFVDRWLGVGRKAAIWHSLYQFYSFPPVKGVPQVLTVHDMNFLYEKNESKVRKYKTRLQKEINRADAITAISEFTRSDLEQHMNLGNKEVQVIHNGVELLKEIQPSQPNFAVDMPFFFSIGIFNPRKNFHLLVELMNHFPNHHLILAGDSNTTYGEFVRRRIEQLHLENRVTLTGKISESDKQWCYQNAEVFLFPSMAEGFGMPPIEAMSYKCPVVLSTSTSLPEIGGDAAFYFDDLSLSTMVSDVKEALDVFSMNKKEWGHKLESRANHFNWTRAAEQYLEVYDRFLL